MYQGAHTEVRGQTCGSQCYPSTTWVLRIKLGLDSKGLYLLSLLPAWNAFMLYK